MSENRMTKIEIITRSSRFEELKEELNKMGVTGMTVSQVLGHGQQKGKSEMYRGVEYEINLLPKVKVEVVVSKIPVDDIIAMCKRVLRTGNVGDGKIFCYDVSRVVRIRTGEEDYDALQDDLAE